MEYRNTTLVVCLLSNRADKSNACSTQFLVKYLGVDLRWVKTMFTGNLLMFVPMGVFLPLISAKINAKSILKIAIMAPVVIEIIQPIMGRSFDVDDLILNFIGINAGYLIAVGIKNLSCKRR